LVTALDSYVQVYKSSNGGQTWSSVSIVYETELFGGISNPTVSCIDGEIDSSGLIHVAITNGSSVLTGCVRNPTYNTFDPDTDTWGTWESCETSTKETVQYIALAIDNNDKPHVMWHETSGNIRYSNKISGSWITHEDLTSKFNSGGKSAFSMISKPNGDLEFICSTSTGYPQRLQRVSGTWGSAINCTVSAVPINCEALIWTNSSSLRYLTSPTGGNLYENDSLIYTDAAGDVSGIGYHKDLSEIIYILGDEQSVGHNNWLCSIKKDGESMWTPFSLYSPNNQTQFALTGMKGLHSYQPTNFIHCIYGVASANGVYIKVPLTWNIPDVTPAYMYGSGHELSPISDIGTTGDWINESSGSTLYPSINDDNDSTYVWIDTCKPGDYFEVKLETPTGTPTGAHILRWRFYKKSGNKPSLNVKYELRQGSSTVIASDTKTIIASGITEYFIWLTSEEISNISDYSDLRARITVLETGD
jgi:hypothetical protein